MKILHSNNNVHFAACWNVIDHYFDVEKEKSYLWFR